MDAHLSVLKSKIICSLQRKQLYLDNDKMQDNSGNKNPGWAEFNNKHLYFYLFILILPTGREKGSITTRIMYIYIINIWPRCKTYAVGV